MIISKITLLVSDTEMMYVTIFYRETKLRITMQEKVLCKKTSLTLPPLV